MASQPITPLRHNFPSAVEADDELIAELRKQLARAMRDSGAR